MKQNAPSANCFGSLVCTSTGIWCSAKSLGWKSKRKQMCIYDHIRSYNHTRICIAEMLPWRREKDRDWKIAEWPLHHLKMSLSSDRKIWQRTQEFPRFWFSYVFILGTPWDPWVWCYVGISILMLLRCSFCSVPSQVWFNWHWVQVGAVLVYNASSTATMFHEQLRCLKPSATQFGQISCQQSPLTPIDCTKLAMDTATLKWTTLLNDTVTPHTVTYITMYFSDLAENSGHPEIQNIQHE